MEANVNERGSRADATAHRIGCAEVWGGIQGDELDVETGSVRGSLFSRACDGGKGGDIYYLSVCPS